MTDLETFVTLMFKIGAKPDSEINEEDGSVTLSISKDGKNIHGYTGFVTSFKFDKEGNLLDIGIYE
jgi:hypothetical protein